MDAIRASVVVKGMFFNLFICSSLMSTQGPKQSPNDASKHIVWASGMFFKNMFFIHFFTGHITAPYPPPHTTTVTSHHHHQPVTSPHPTTTMRHVTSPTFSNRAGKTKKG